MDDDTTRDDAAAEEPVAEERTTGEASADESPVTASAEGSAQVAPPKKIGARQIFLFGVLLALVTLWVASAVDIHLLKGAIAQVAQAEIDIIIADYNITGSEDDRYRIATVVTPTRKYEGFKESYPPDPNDEILNTLSLGFLFGKPSAKLTIYVQDREFEEHGTSGNGGGHDHGVAKIVGYDYYYVIKDEKWFSNESSRCSAEDCELLGMIEFEKLDRKKK